MTDISFSRHDKRPQTSTLHNSNAFLISHNNDDFAQKFEQQHVVPCGPSTSVVTRNLSGNMGLPNVSIGAG